MNDIPARLARARAATERRRQDEENEAALAEVERFELAEKLEAELGGREGRMFAIVDGTALGEGFIGLRHVDGNLWQIYLNSKMSVMDRDALVIPHVVHPSVEKYREIATRRPQLAERAGVLLRDLYGAARAEREKK
jgi:hypothetical protein